MMMIRSYAGVAEARAAIKLGSFNRPHRRISAAASAARMLYSRTQQQQKRCFLYHSTSCSLSSHGIDRLGLGSVKWRQCGDLYGEIVKTALQSGITTIEAGVSGGDAALAAAYRQSVPLQQQEQQQQQQQQPVNILFRVGYREVMRSDDDDHDALNEKQPSQLAFANDVVQQMPNTDKDDDVDDSDSHQLQGVIHNISPDWIHYAVTSSPLVQLKQDYPESVRLTVMLHNPEAQAARTQHAAAEQLQTDMQDRLTDSFVALQQMCDTGIIDGFGVTSNGLSLPPNHPLHVSYETVLAAAKRAAAAAGDDNQEKPLNFSAIQLPANALETAGFAVARQIQRAKRNDGAALSLSNLAVYGMRPLTCYPDAGAGTGRPFLLSDYQMPATMDKSLQWTNEMAAPPVVYDVALKQAVSHFDAEELLEKKQETELTAEDRETLDGCKLMQSVLHDLDGQLETMRSFAAHEDALFRQVIPVVKDTFETYDEDTANILQSFFGAYNMAVRYHVARNTRRLLLEGDGGSSAPTYDRESELPDTKRLQEFGLELVLKQTVDDDDDGGGGDAAPGIDKIILGSSQPTQVLDAVEIVRKYCAGPEPASGDEKATE